LSAPLLFLALDVAAVVCALLLAAQVLTEDVRNRSAQLIAAISVCNVCFVVLSRYEYRIWIPEAYRIDVGMWRPALHLAQNLTPGMVMLLSHSLFSERRRFPRWLLALFVLQVFLEEPVRWLIPGRDQPAWANAAAAGLEVLFAGVAIYWALASWRADLVEARRRLRIAVFLVIGLNVVGSTTLRVAFLDTRTNYYAYIGLLALNLVLLAVFVLLRFPAEEIGERPAVEPNVRPLRPPTGGHVEAQTAAALARLVSLLEVEHVYREPGLSLNDLAGRVGLPEYRLRKLIHEQLGYRNFNMFIHDYRVREACAQLSDPEMRRLPILTIALSVGYQSVNTFNRGFGAIMGMTPSAFRSEADLTRAAAAKSP
jgi:AraC-like DNA-binding protein